MNNSITYIQAGISVIVVLGGLFLMVVSGEGELSRVVTGSFM